VIPPVSSSSLGACSRSRESTVWGPGPRIHDSMAPNRAASVLPGVRYRSAPGTDSVREERKVVTVLFADLTGSTALGECLDPEQGRPGVPRLRR